MRQAAALPLLLACLLLTVPGAGGQQLPELEADLARARAVAAEQDRQVRDLSRELERLTASEGRLNAQAGEASARLSRVEGELSGVRSRVADLAAAAEAAAQRITALDARVVVGKREVQGLMLALYRERSVRYLRLIVRAESVSQLLARSRYVGFLGRADVRAISRLKADLEALAGE